jgi:hypothetical protein
MATATREQIAEVYVATFNRAADANGLKYWISDGTSDTTTLTDIVDIAEAMLASKEVKDMYGDPSAESFDREAFIIKLYANILNKTVDGTDEGVKYWMDSTDVSNAKMIIALINGAKADTGDPADKATLANKTAVGLAFADAGLNDVERAKEIMSGVTDDPATVDSAEAVILGDATITVTEPTAEPENTEVAAGTVIATVTIADGVTYTLTGDDASMFTLDTTTGEIKATDAYTPDYETKSSYSFTIEAVDADGKKAIKDLSIAVTDIEPEGTTTALTTETDTLVGTDANDTFSGVISSLSSEKTLNADDTIDGGAGTDTLNLDMKGNLSALKGSIKNVENINLTNSTTITRTFDATHISDVTKYTIDGAKGVNLSNLSDAGIEVSLKGVQANSTIAFNSKTDLKGTSDAMSLTFDGLGSAQVLKDDGVTVQTAEVDTKITMASIEDLTIKTQNNDSFVDLSAMDATKYTVSGDKALTISAIKSGLTEVDASTMTGALKVDTTGAASTAISSVQLGSADDTFIADAADLVANATISGGDGADVLKLSDSSGSTLQLNMSGVETLAMINEKATTISAKSITDLTTVEIDANGNNTVNVVNLGSNDITLKTVGTIADAQDVTLDTSGTATIQLTASTKGVVDGAKGTGTAYADAESQAGDIWLTNASTANITVGDYVKYTGATNGITAAKATEIVLTVNSSKNAATTPTQQTQFNSKLSAAKATSLTIDSKGDTTITGGDLKAVQTAVIKAGGSVDIQGTSLDSAANVTLSGDETTSKVKTGNIGATTTDYNVGVTATGLKAGLTLGDIASKQEASITLTGTTGDVTLGNIDAANVTISAENLAGEMKLTSGTNIDASSANKGTASINVSNATKAVTLGAIGSDNAFAEVNVNLKGNLSTSTIGTITAKEVTIDASDALKAVTIGDAVDGDGDITITDSLTYTAGLKGANTATADVDVAIGTTATNTTVTLNGNIGDDGFEFTTGEYANDAKLIIKGDLDIGTNNVTVTAAAEASGNVVTIDLSELKGAVSTTSVDITGGSGNDIIKGATVVAATIDGGAGDDTITGGAGADTIDGGDGDDTITGGAGNDRINGGDGANTITGGAGDDTITLGTAGTAETVKIAFGGEGQDSIVTFAADEDVIEFTGTSDVTGTSITAGGFGTADLTADAVTISKGLTVVNDDNTAAISTTAEIAKALAGTATGSTGNALSFANADNVVYIALDNGTDSVLIKADDTNGDTVIDAGDITIIATLTGLADASTLTAADFADFA